jgi:hypothetical protein
LRHQGYRLNSRVPQRGTGVEIRTKKYVHGNGHRPRTSSINLFLVTH